MDTTQFGFYAIMALDTATPQTNTMMRLNLRAFCDGPEFLHLRDLRFVPDLAYELSFYNELGFHGE